ncbi:ChrR family anti-sigma-E factor [Bowmanella yangjiangensis]|uniref:Cupin domain-containing protein n=1 Tax=Bowmanella yangjiangensis TaxID=2811230 RepID=A0ABS3CZQ3_9ALTE|nr:ChrR family anti-sigma-E factor [Bowmanella yangjiangensis]MBN7822029.1 cupin domain-containing protein [Bowmanella yangjiangensis]
MKIKLHPTDQQLVLFAQGLIAPAQSLIISAHVDMCAACQKRVAGLEAALTEQLLNEQSALPDMQMQNMLTEILASPVAVALPAETQYLELDGRQFALPRSLQRYAGKISGWSHMVGKLWQARVDLGIDGRADFIYMEKGGTVPEHTHRGSELTLVLDGEFSDGVGHYDTGDFIRCDSHHTHTPKTEAEEGCLVFSVLDKPLHFTSGLARLLNPFSHLFFK